MSRYFSPLVAPLTPADGRLADLIFLAGWSPGTHGPIGPLLGPLLGTRQAAEAAADAWHRAVLGDAAYPPQLPAALPGGHPIPAATTPWGRELSPIPGVDLPVERVIELAWYLLEPESQREATRDEVEMLAGMVTPPLPGELAEDLITQWKLREGPEGCVHAAHPRRLKRWFSPDEIESFLAHMRSALQGGEEEKVRRRAAFRMLVLARMDRYDASYQCIHWSPFRRELPTGQWLPEQGGSELSKEGLIRLAEVLVPRTYLPELLTLLGQGQKIAAIKRLRQVIRCGLKEAKDAVESIDLRLGLEQREGQRRVKRPAERGAGRALIDRAIDRLILARPLHWMLLATAEIVEDGALPTMAVALTCQGEVALFFSPDFVAQISPEELESVLLHEIHHVLFGHLGPPPALPAGGPPLAGDEAAQERRRQNAWLVACELVANEYVPGPLPGSPLTLSRFGQPAGLATIRHYEALLQRDDLPDLVDDRRVALLVAAPRHSRDHEPELYPAAAAAQSLVRIAIQAVGAEIDRATTGMLAGTELGRAIEWVQPEGLGELPWDTLLGRLARGLKERLTTRSFPSRRAPERVGIVPGHRSRRDPPVVLAAIDTSASMTSEELTTISGELLALTKQQVRVVCVQIDTQIRQVDELRRGTTIERIVGRGGTDFRPVFHPATLARYRPSLIVYFTDGEGPAPEAAPAGVEVLWVLTGASPSVPCRWGRAVCLQPRHNRQRVSLPPA